MGKKMSAHQRRFVKKERVKNKLRKQGKSEEEIESYILEHFYQSDRLPDSRKQDKIEKTRKEEKKKREENQKGFIHDILENQRKSGDSVKSKNGKKEEKRRKEGLNGKKLGNTKHIGASNQLKTTEGYAKTLTALINKYGLKDVTEINDNILQNEVNTAVKDYYNGDFKATGRINKVLSAVNSYGNATKNSSDDVKMNVNEDIQSYRDQLTSNKVFRVKESSSWLKANENDVREAIQQIESAKGTVKSEQKREAMTMLQKKLMFEYVAMSRADATTSTKIDDIYIDKENGTVDLLQYRDKGDKTRVNEIEIQEHKEFILEVLNEAVVDGRESLFQLRKADGSLKSYEASEMQYKELLNDYVHISRTEIIEAKRTNSMMAKEVKQWNEQHPNDKRSFTPLKTEVAQKFVGHSARKAGGLERAAQMVHTLQTMGTNEKNEYKNEQIQKLIRAERKTKKYLQEKGKKYNVMLKQLKDEPRVQQQYNYLLSHQLNGKEREKPLNHLSDIDFARFVISIKMGHSRLDVVDSYINKDELKKFIKNNR